MRPVLAIALSACGRLEFDHTHDASIIDSATPCTFSPWGSPVPLAELNSVAEDFSSSLSTDGLTVVFTSDRLSGGNDLFQAMRTGLDVPFAPPEPLTAINTAGAEQAPSISLDGLTLYYARDSRLQRATRTSQTAQFTNPVSVAELANVMLLAVEITAAGDELFFTRNGGVERATYQGGVFTPTGPVAELNAGSTCCTTFTHDGLTVYIASDRAGTLDIYSSSRAAVGAPFSVPVREPALSSSATEDDPDLSDDGTTMIVASDRNGTTDLFAWTRTCE